MIRVAVTGMGVVSPVGIGVGAFWRSLCAGVGGLGPITRFDPAPFDVRQAFEVKGFVWPESLGPEPDLATRFAVVAAEEARRQSGLGAGPERGVAVATNFGGVTSAEPALGRPAADGTAYARWDEVGFQRAADHVAGAAGWAGPRVAMSLSCASGAAAIGYAADQIRAGRAEAMLAGGYDALSVFCWSGLSCLRTMTKDRIRPFDLKRSGTIFGEGAAMVVLERLDRAVARGAVVLAELLGHAMNNNAFHMTAPDKDGGGVRSVMEMALRDAGVAPGEIDHVNAHATGTKYNDVTETLAIKAVLGERARAIPVNGIKAMTGHTMGAAGAMEALATVLAIRDGIIPPTMNLETPDPECDLDYVPGAAARRDVRTAISNSAGIGGCNAALVFRRFDE